MKIITFLFFALLSIRVAYSAPQEATLIIKYPAHSAIVINAAAKISVNGADAVPIETSSGGADNITEIIMKVPIGITTIESSHWNRENTNYINRFEVQGGKSYTIVVYMMMLQINDTIFSAMQNMLVKNLEPEKESYKDWTIKNQVISIK